MSEPTITDALSSINDTLSVLHNAESNTRKHLKEGSLMQIDTTKEHIIEIDLPTSVYDIRSIVVNGKEILNVENMLATDVDLRLAVGYEFPRLTIKGYPIPKRA